MTGPLRGALLGCANATVIAFGMCFDDGGGLPFHIRDRAFGFTLVALVACIPGAIFGAMVGRLADNLVNYKVWMRRLALISTAFTVVVFLGGMAELNRYVLISFIPTLAAALFLETRTRASFHAAVPLATAR
jgi:hypothetical protein